MVRIFRPFPNSSVGLENSAGGMLEKAAEILVFLYLHKHNSAIYNYVTV